VKLSATRWKQQGHAATGGRPQAPYSDFLRSQRRRDQGSHCVLDRLMAELRLRKGWTDQAKILALGSNGWGVKIIRHHWTGRWSSKRLLPVRGSWNSEFSRAPARSLLPPQRYSYFDSLILGSSGVGCEILAAARPML